MVVLPGDTPLLRPQTLAALVRYHRAEDAGATLLTAEVVDSSGYGRVVHGKDGVVCRVVEEVDATDEEKAITEINTSIYCFRRSILAPALRRLTPANAQGEYYLTDAVSVLFNAGYRVQSLVLHDSMEAAGVNDRAQLAVAEADRCGTALRQRALDAAGVSPCGTPNGPTSTPRSDWPPTCPCCPG